jgi:hypothetical protein
VEIMTTGVADKENPQGAPRRGRRKVAMAQRSSARSKVDCGQPSTRGLAENGGTPAKRAKTAAATRPVGRTMVMLTSTAAKHGGAPEEMPDDSLSFRELAMHCMPDLNEEWRAVLNTKLTKQGCADTKKRLEQQTNLVKTLKSAVDLGKQQRECFLGRVQGLQARLQGRLSQLTAAKQGAARAETLRTEVQRMEAELQALESETKAASERAQSLEAELGVVEQRSAEKDVLLEETRTLNTEAQVRQTLRPDPSPSMRRREGGR